jgi:hypothetical protein
LSQAEIGDDRIRVSLEPETGLETLIPRLSLSPRASVFPLTADYVEAAFPGVDPLAEAPRIQQVRNIADYVMDKIRETPGFSPPAISRPIDFNGPVDFLALSALGTIRRYTVYALSDQGEPRLVDFGFSKARNPELAYDAFCRIDEAAATLDALVLYSTEASPSYAPLPFFEILGDRLEVDGEALGSQALRFSPEPEPSPQRRTLTVYRKKARKAYAPRVYFAEAPGELPPDTGEPRLLGFGFSKRQNPDLVRDAFCRIDEAGGKLEALAFYPAEMEVSRLLVPSFEILGDRLEFNGKPWAPPTRSRFPPGRGPIALP